MTFEQNRIFPLAKADLPALAVVERDLFQDPWSFQMLLKEYLNPRVRSYKIVSDGSLAAYAFVHFLTPEADLHNIAVLPPYQRQGLGALLLKALIADCRKVGCERIQLEVREGNLAARGLYESQGFKVVGKREGYYIMDTENAVLYTKELDR